jgi:hypothetical protein
VSAGAADLSSMRSSKTTNNPYVRLTPSLSAAMSAEVSSAAAKLANQTNTMSTSIPASVSSSVTPALASEKTRAEAKCASSVSGGALSFSQSPSQVQPQGEYASW